MYKQEIKRDLVAIFGIQRILFDTFSLGREMDAIFVGIENVRNVFKHGVEYHRITGTLDICSSKLSEDYLTQKYFLAERFGLSISADSQPIQFSYNGNDFEKVTVRFEYRMQKEFGTERRQITEIQWRVNYV